MKREYMVVYKTTNAINGIIYIGKSIQNAPSYFGGGIHLTRAIEKYGKENFKKEILEVCLLKEHLCEREKFWIKNLDSQNPLIGYNISIGGDGGGHKCTEESKKKMSESHKGKKASDESRRRMRMNSARYMLGKEHTAEAKVKISKAAKGRIPWNKGIPHTEETKRKISENCSGFMGKHHTEETRRYMSNLKRGIPRSHEVIQKIKETKRRKRYEQSTVN